MTNFLAVGGMALAIYGATVLCGIGIAALVAWSGHTDASRALADDVDAALSSLGKHGSLAEDIFGIKESSAAPRLSRALQHGDPLNLWRLGVLPPAFWLALCDRLAVRYGAVLFHPPQAELLRGAGRVSTKKMARMGIRIDAERKQTA